jgi:DNA-binding beta-propeller fold protein YncE
MNAQSGLLTWDLYHSSGVGSVSPQTVVAFSSDSKTLAIASEDQRLRLWNAATGTLEQTVSLQEASLPRDKHYYMGQPASLSPDGSLFVTTYSREDKNLKVWDAKTGVLRWMADSEEGPVAFSPDGSTLAIAGLRRGDYEGKSLIQFFDAQTGTAKPPKIAPSSKMHQLAYSPDGKVLAAGGSFPAIRRGNQGIGVNGEVRLWDAQTGKMLHTLTGPSDVEWAIAFSPDSKTLAVGSRATREVDLWDVATGKKLRSFQAEPMKRVSLVNQGIRSAMGIPKGHGLLNFISLHKLVYSPDGTRLVGANHRDVQIWDARTGQVLDVLRLPTRPRNSGTDVGDIAISPDSTLLAVANKRDRSAMTYRIQ